MTEIKKKRVAAYARVSTNQKAQEHSFNFQTEYWNKTLSVNPDYEYVGLYADKGISGKYATRRPQFMTLIEDALNGKIDIIYTKSVQRFARNTEDLLTIVRSLREKNIAVVFEKENINTLNIASELYLTVAAAVAEDDLTRYSQNVNWTIKKKYENGENVMGHILYGYKVIKNKDLIVNPKEAKTIKEIYELYSTGNYSAIKIANILNDKGINAPLGGKWCDTTIRGMLKNEKYSGDLMLQKYYTEKGIKHINNGEKDKYFVENNHEAIISRDLWNKVQDVFDRRSNKKLIGGEQKVYSFSGMITCGVCGSNYIHKVNNTGTKSACEYWNCANSCKNGIKACNTTGIKDRVIKEKFVECYNEFVTNKYTGTEETPLTEALTKLYVEEGELNQLNAQGLISKNDYEKEHKRVVSLIKENEIKLENIRMYHVSEKDFQTITTFDEDILHKFIKKVTVKRWIVAFEFYNGIVISKKYTNGKPGNIMDWKRLHGKGGKH